jgi:hypothetical protein
MNDGGVAMKNNRPEWLIISLSVTSAIVAYRLSGAIFNNLLFILNFDLFGWQFHAGLIFSLISAVLIAIFQHRIFTDKSMKINKIVLMIFLVLAILPLRANTEVDFAVMPSDAAIEELEILPVRFACKIIEGDTVLPNVVIDNSHVLDAKVSLTPTGSNDSYSILLQLTPEGQAAIRKATSQNIGNLFGYWIDGELVCSPKIHTEILGDSIYMPIDKNLSEAKRLAEGIILVKS